MFHHASFRPASPRALHIVAGRVMVCGLLAGMVCGNTPTPTAGEETARTPDFAADPGVSWSLEGRLDDLVPPAPQPLIKALAEDSLALRHAGFASYLSSSSM